MRFYSTVLFVTLAACGTRDYQVTRTGGSVAGPKPANCDFVIATTKLDRPYQEIAILDPKDYVAHDAAEFKQAIARDVCQLGGDGVVAEVNGTGRYIRGTVVRWTDTQ